MSSPDADQPPAPPPPHEPATSGAVPTAAAPDDANDLRGLHYRRLLRKPLTLVLIGLFMLVAAIGGAVGLGPGFGAIGAIAALLISLLIVFGIADSQAEEDFFRSYAAQRGLELGGRSPLPPTTPLLRKGDDRYAERTLSGVLAEGVEGILALYTYEDETTDSEGNSETNYYRYTVGLVPLPESVAHVPELYCQRKFGLHALEKFEDAFRRSKERVKLESEALDDKYEIFAGKGQDANWLRQLFAPTFIVWLTESAPKKFAFELVDGSLCCYVSGHRKKAEELDEICAATAAVAKRLHDESTE